MAVLEEPKPPLDDDGGGRSDRLEAKKNDLERDRIEALSTAESLKLQAKRARLEAERMDARLTLDKIATLERRAERLRETEEGKRGEGREGGGGGATEKEEEENDVRVQIDLLRRKLEGPPSPPPSAGSDHAEPNAAPTSVDVDDDEDDATEEEGPLSPMDPKQLEEEVQNFLRTPKVLRELTAKAAGFDDDSNATAIVLKMRLDEEVARRRKEKRKKLGKAEDTVEMTEENLRDAEESIENLPSPIRDVLARSVGLADGSNATLVLNELVKEGKLRPSEEGDGGTSFEIETDEVLDLFVDADDFVETAGYVRSMFPECTRKPESTPSEEDVEKFFSECLGKATFNPTCKPESVPGGFLIRGENRCKGRTTTGDVDDEEEENRGDALVEALDEALSSSSVASELRYHYVRDPTPASEEQIETGDVETPVLYVTGIDVSPDTNGWVKPTISILGLLAICSFALGTFAFNEIVANRLNEAANAVSAGGTGAADDASLTWLKDLASPVALSVLGIQLAHELGHWFVAIKDKIKVGPPTLVPSFQLGLTGTVTPILTPPKNLKSLFDFAISGPLLGIAVSVLLLYSGLELTAFATPEVRATLPGLTVELLRSSSLGGGMVQWLLGDGVLLSPTPGEAIVPLHPYAIAGFGGIVTNALCLLPIGNTDGGRISHAVFGRSFSRVVQGFALLILVLSGFFGYDESNLLLSYAIFATLWQKEPEIPCRNEVDELDLTRGLIAIATAFVAVLSIVPIVD